MNKNTNEYPKIQESKHLRKILVTVCIALMAVIASVTGLNVAQPELAIEFNASQGTVIWMINIYTLCLAALLLPLGAIGDRLGRKPVLLVGLLIFGFSNALAGLAPSATIVIIARLLSGIGAAMIMPITLAVITSSFPPEKRSKAVGIWTAVAGGGGMLGMFISALLIDFADWRWLFALPIALVIIALVMTLRFVPDSHEKTTHKFDWVGTLLSITAIIGIVYALHEAPSKGWLSTEVIISGIVGLSGIISFILWELNNTGPLLDIKLFRKQGLSAGSVTLITVFGVLAGIFVVLFPYFQVVLGWSGLGATLAMMPMVIVMMACSGLAPKISNNIGKKLTMTIGIFFSIVGLILMASLVSVEGGFLSVLPGMLFMGAGMGLAMTPSTEAITSSLPENRQGVASALNDLTRELGSALGVALLGALVTAGYSNAVIERLSDVPHSISSVASEGIANALAIADKADSQSTLIIEAAKTSFVEGWAQAMWIGTVIMGILLTYILFRGPKNQKDELE